MLEKVLGKCDKVQSLAGHGGHDAAGSRAVTFEFYSVTYRPDGSVSSYWKISLVVTPSQPCHPTAS